MKTVNISQKTSNFCVNLAHSSQTESDYFPVDRVFLEKHLEKIFEIDVKEFLIYNLNLNNPTYTSQLLICLPELWINLNYKDILLLIENFETPFAYQIFLEFSYKHLRIDMLEDVIDIAILNGHFLPLRDFLLNFWETLYMDESEKLELLGNVGVKYFKYDFNVWKKISERILTEVKHMPLPINDPEYIKNRIYKILR